MATQTVLNYLGMAFESGGYGSEAAPLFYIDIASAGLDAPDEAEIIHPGGLTRFPRDHQPGIYIPSGPVEMVADMSYLYYLLKYFLGNSAFTDNTGAGTPKDFSTGVAETTWAGNMTDTPVVPAHAAYNVTVIEDPLGVPVDVAEDDGFGNLVEIAASGVTGTIDYATGAVTLDGLTASTDYSITADKDTFEYILTPDTAQDMKSLTLELGKQQFQHTFLGCCINQLTLNTEREWVMASLEILAQQDKKETIESWANYKAKSPQGYPAPFHDVTAKMADYGASLGDVSADVQSLNFVGNNNATAEEGTTIGSRFPRRVWKGQLDIAAEMSLVFDGTEEYEDFWGGAAGPAVGGTVEKAFQFKINAVNGIGDVTIDLFKCIIQSIKTPVAGRDRISQAVRLVALLDESIPEIIKATCNSIYNWDLET